MSRARAKCFLALTVVFALVAMFAVPALAIAEESVATDEAAAATDAAATEAAPVAEVAPAAEEAAVTEVAPAEIEAPIEAAAPAEEVVAADTSAAATAQAPAAPLASKVGARFATKKTTTKVALVRKSNASRSQRMAQIACSDVSLLSQWSLVPTRTVAAGQTTFTWTLTYTPTADPTDGDERCAAAGISHIEITVCLEADGSTGFPDSSAELLGGSLYTYKWDQTDLPAGSSFSLIYDGDIPGGGSAIPLYKKQGQLVGASSTGPNCTPAACASWTLDVDVTNTGTGTGTVSDNHGNTTGVDVTWTYDATQMTNVDLTSAGTGGSTSSSTGQNDVSFSAHPGCNADYAVTFDKTGSQCTSWTLDVDVTNTGIGTGTVSDNHGNTTGVDATWTYDATEMANVDLTSAGTGGSSSNSTGQNDVSFSAHPGCNADYAVTFDKTDSQCTSWTLDVDITGTGTAPGTGTVSDNHGNTTSSDATWTYNSTQVGDVDIIASGTNGSSANDTGETNVAFSAHPSCDADYAVTFHKDNQEPDCNGDFDASNNASCNPTPDCNGDFDASNNASCNPTPDCNGDFDASNNGVNGDCTNPPPVNDCSGDTDPNNNGVNGDCTEPVVDATDLCSNMDGDQSAVPEGMFVNEAGECVKPDTVLGIRLNAKPELGFAPVKPDAVLGLKVAPQNVAAGVLPFTGASLVPFLIVSGLLLTLGTSLTIRSRKGSAG